MTHFNLSDEIRDEAQAAWRRYLDLLIPFRPQLHRYCRRLTGDIWEAEDLVQDTVLKGFGRLGATHHSIQNPRAYLIRIATNLWIDAMRRRGIEETAMREQPDEAYVHVPDPIELRNAGAALMHRLAPQERAAVLMKDVFEMSLEEIAAVLGTTQGAIKAALQRGRSRLRESADPPKRRQGLTPTVALVDRFVELLNASDLPGLLALMLDNGSVEMLGNLYESGRDEFERKGSWFWHAVHVHPELPPEMRPPKFHNEREIFGGEPLMLSFAPIEGSMLLAAVTRLEEWDGRIARVRSYQFCPETVAEVGEALGRSVLPLPYRFPVDVPGS
jgi:RNA polymerase sigma-70 factor, ECF subfamily